MAHVWLYERFLQRTRTEKRDGKSRNIAATNGGLRTGHQIARDLLDDIAGN